MSAPPEQPPSSTTIVLRAPTTSSAPSTSTTAKFTPPSTEWLSGTWHVTNSTLPMWRKSRNVSITYTPILPPASLTSPSFTNPLKLTDEVKYQTLSTTTSPSSSQTQKHKTITGIDTPAGPGAYNWRGSGWLKIASSYWEILGYGGEEGQEQWAVTYFAKTLFTPAGVDVYSRQREGLSEETMKRIVEALGRIEDATVRQLAGELFDVKRD